MYEELTFAAGWCGLSAVGEADVTMTCSYPYTSWALRRPRGGKKRRPAHVFVTQNGDWPAQGSGPEPRFFSCEGLICTNPIYFERNQERWKSTLIPNGVDPVRFHPGPERKAELGLPTDRPVVLMVSAIEPGKRVIEAMQRFRRSPTPFWSSQATGRCARKSIVWRRKSFPSRIIHALDVPPRADAGPLSQRRFVPAHQDPGVVRQRLCRSPELRHADRRP